MSSPQRSSEMEDLLIPENDKRGVRRLAWPFLRAQMNRKGFIPTTLVVITLAVTVSVLFNGTGEVMALSGFQRGGVMQSPIVVNKTDPEPQTDPQPEPKIEEPRWSPWVVGQPTRHFRDNLRNDTKYVTTWAPGGWTNDVMSYFNTIYIASISNRVAVLPPFIPSHLPLSTPPIRFGEIFDLPRLSKDSGVRVMDFSDVKDPQSESLDDIGCWSIWATANPSGGTRGSRSAFAVNLDPSYTPIPRDAKLYPHLDHDWHVKFWSLAALMYPDYRKQMTQEMGFPDAYEFNGTTPSERHKHTLPPDDHLTCFDFTYFVSASRAFEYDYDYSPAWRFVGTYARWNPRILELADQYLRRAFGLSPAEQIPPFVSVHARHGEFTMWCNGLPAKECFAPLSAYARRVTEVQDELRETKGINATRVLFTSDEKDPEWWAGVKELGWITIDHDQEETTERYGLWYTVVLDAIFQSLGAGFVGTDRSTFSLLSRRRVIDWYDGAWRDVKWGHPGADDH
ncbi:hypothetical protein BD410DRAFT_781803 [Rickenella mellea]|uniref:Uncharacterized protein n=1 Tax=Rickenella mellea TaxID=50990 RepID=A0A4Y7QKV1_9AGAM|nr:hypothetical protein BD410DRAFT_781803 [Rickenella mellea]